MSNAVKDEPLEHLGLAQHFADIGGRAVSYLQRSGDPTVVLIPGSHQDCRQFDQVLPRLDQRLGVVIVELPGHRASTQLPEDLSIERFGLDVVAVVAQAELRRFVVGGHSLGGMVSIELARLNPAGLSGIIAIEGWTHCSVAQVLGGPRMYGTLSSELFAEQDRRRQWATGHRTPQQRALLSGLWTRWGGLEILQRTDLPVLELWGDRNLSPRPDQEALQVPRRPNITLRWFAGASHNLPLERPVELSEVINRWLTEMGLWQAGRHEPLT